MVTKTPWVVLLLLAGCARDADGDGVLASADCDDEDAARAPVIAERCDGVDNDCDGEVDEGVLATFHADADGDGYGDPDGATDACAAPDGAVVDGSDCDDAAPGVHPGADDPCDAVDQDCDGRADEGSLVWFVDLDGDGVGAATAAACAPGPGLVERGGDCDDEDPGVFPGAAEVCDGVDQDCDAAADEGLGATHWPDADGDGYGDPAGLAATRCDGAAGFVANDLDCDDAFASVFPGAVETCDALDNDCDGSTDEDVTTPSFEDDDADGYGDPATRVDGCGIPAGAAANPFDCDDAEPLAHTGATEACDGVDNDCDGGVDENQLIEWWVDDDGDGQGSPDGPGSGCALPAGGVALDDDDCDDTDPAIRRGAAEVCDGVDQDCDGVVDEGLTIDWWTDGDGDGHGDPLTRTTGCTPPSTGVAFVGNDCDDAVPTTYGGATEPCDGVDNDCDGGVDEGLLVAWWPDGDADGHGVDGTWSTDCVAPPGAAFAGGDCDDVDPTVYDGAPEACDGVDDDCDGAVDEGVAGVFWPDGDGDGYGASDTAPTRACVQPPATASIGGDCDDVDPGLGGPTCAPELAGSWITWGGDDARTGHAPGFVGGGLPTAAWTTTFTGAVVESVVIEGGAVYLTADDSSWMTDDQVVALDLATGATLWTYVLDESSYPTGPSVEDGRVYVQRVNSSDAHLVAIDAATGIEQWRAPFGVQWDQFLAPLVMGSDVYMAGGTYGGMYAFDGSTGAQLWFEPTEWYDEWTPVGYQGQVWTHLGGALVRHNPVNGDPVSSVSVPAAGFSYTMGTVPAFADGTAVLVGGDDLLAVDLATGAVRWTLASGFSGSPTLANGLVYAVRNGAVVQVDAAVGDLLRVFGSGQSLAGKPVVTDDVLVASSATTTHLYAIWDTTELASLPVGGDLAVGEGAVVVVDGADVYVYEIQ